MNKLLTSVIGSFIRFHKHFSAYLMNRIGGMGGGGIPSWSFRRFCYKMKGMKIGYHSTINLHTYVMSPEKIVIGDKCHINRGVLLDGRGGLTIGDNVSISYNVAIMTGGHDPQTVDFQGKFLPIIIEDNVWIGVNATILQGVTIGKGAVVAAGAVVTKNADSYTFVGGVPAKKIGERRTDLNYSCDNTFAKFI